jgi:hypothetical protein
MNFGKLVNSYALLAMSKSYLLPLACIFGSQCFAQIQMIIQQCHNGLSFAMLG